MEQCTFQSLWQRWIANQGNTSVGLEQKAPGASCLETLNWKPQLKCVLDALHLYVILHVMLSAGFRFSWMVTTWSPGLSAFSLFLHVKRHIHTSVSFCMDFLFNLIFIHYLVFFFFEGEFTLQACVFLKIMWGDSCFLSLWAPYGFFYYKCLKGWMTGDSF